MKYIYTQEFYGITNVKMEFYDKNTIHHYIVMEYDKAEHYWSCECDEEVVRYKFIVNDIIRLNDPQAKHYVLDEKQEVWSVQGTMDGYEAKLETYCVSDSVRNSVKDTMKKATCIYDRPLDIYVGASIHQVNGIHSLTYMCFQPDGRLYKLEECCIGQCNQEADYEVVFMNHIAHMSGSVAGGMWTFQVYLDGKCIIKDYFVLKRKVINNMSLLNYKM